MPPEPQDKERKTPQVVEIEATDGLVEGQNFYDQEPFSTVIAQTAAETQTDPVRLRKILSTFCLRYFKDPADIPSDNKVTDILTSPKYNPGFEQSYSASFEPGQKEKYQKAVASIGRLLAPYPSWYAYVRTMERAYYNRDGSYKENAPRFFSPKTYPKWLEAESRVRTGSVTFGIKEVFPQDFATESPAISPKPAGPTGKKPLHRVYRIQRQMK
ncbi:MAG: hypothetical protein UV59_C0040G0004 [Candidatus Gottesmanbacteria bacterium GW2011_GWA1_43_11]|uniref:Uncharacterized protein n=1 Tax=Candidatus Gottesmanbacteria bacterium GW2011_GWA1_43_11 TaxID=1618436 RepID=A0A0G1CCX9_9BACT|nr:MAG: hypothetical protein UV59_C0040G0004 [Candidatus Gottesmanbacteria bacterium GW2011_GWA1_43_11]